MPYADELAENGNDFNTLLPRILSSELRPKISDTCDAGLKKILERCWNDKKSVSADTTQVYNKDEERPTHTEISEALKSASA